MGAHYCGLDVGTSRLIAQTMTLSIATQSSEVWQMDNVISPIQAELNEIYRGILGVEKGTCISAVRHELGVASQRVRADAAALKFRNYILSMDNGRLPKKIYNELRSDSKGSGHRRNSVLKFFEPLAKKANWTEIVGKYAAKEAARKYIVAKQNDVFKVEIESKSTLENLKVWTDVEKTGPAKYLLDSCPIGLRRGPSRMLKTRMRLGCHDLFVSAKRKESDRSVSGMRCLCCNRGSVETVRHALFECPEYDDIRTEFFEIADEVVPQFSVSSDNEKCVILFSDDTDSVLGKRSFRFFINVFKRRLVNLAARGEGFRPQATLL